MILSRYSYEEMELSEIIDVVDVEKTIGFSDQTITGITYDSRLVSPGYLFVALNGESFKGIEFVDEAAAKGAVAIISEEEFRLPKGMTLIKVRDSRKAMAELACSFHSYPSSHLQCFGITGTNGKTTTSYLLRSILMQAGQKTGLIGTVEQIVGDRVIPAVRTTPEATELQALMEQMLEVDCQSVVMEVSSHALEQQRMHGTKLDCAIFTNLSQDHLDYHGDMEEYFNSKTKITDLLDQQAPSCLVVNTDDAYGKRLVEDQKLNVIKVITYGLSSDADVRAEEVSMSMDGVLFKLHSPWGNCMIKTPLHGRFNVSNTLAAIAAAGVRGISLQHIRDALQAPQIPPGRLERIPGGKGYVFVDYAHTDQALEHVLLTLRELHHGPLTVVFGCGGDRDPAKRSLMAEAVARYADRAIITNDNPRTEDPEQIVNDILQGFPEGFNVEIMLDRELAIAEALRSQSRNEITLIAGKGHENYMEINNRVIPFSDRQVVQKILQENER